ncbi:MAG: exodeoxyribonuclease III [Oscillospiraceae bacterium]|jgi:exodeoxyribonuclease-3|nr:exodeoxyribonuclease III [Oscillospiraceae bacterium]
MKLISWNVNGLRSCVNKGFFDFLEAVDADVFCIQETKMNKTQANFVFPNYYEFWNSARKKGYSGTLVLTKNKPLNTNYKFIEDEFLQEGRVITLEFDNFFLINSYTPNSQRKLLRLNYRMQWEDRFKDYLLELANKKSLILCGDFNVAHKEIDIKYPNKNRQSAGFTDEERKKFSNLIDLGFIDTFRFKCPDKNDAYTWWSYLFNARQKNIGWRIDYFLTFKIDSKNILDAKIYSEILGSDHCPIELLIDI